ncbi:protein RIC-3 [Vanacampus margaritifer]
MSDNNREYWIYRSREIKIVELDNMSITTCQKITLISCSVLCVSLFLPRMLLPRAKKEMGQPQVGPGFHPPGMHQVSLSDDPEQWGVDPFHSVTYNAEATAKVRSIGRGKKYNLMAQAIPIYGFGILLYILYIIHKLTCKDKNTKSETYSTSMSMEGNMATDDDLAKLQERLLQSESIMARIVSGNTCASGSGRRRKSKSTPTKKEEKLLRQLRQIAQVMQEGRVEGASPEMEAEEVPYSADWEGYPEETYPEYEVPDYKCEFEHVAPEKPTSQPTAEALAERMEQEEEEVVARKLSVVKEEDEDEEEEEEGAEEEGADAEDVEEDTEEEEEEEEAEAEKRLLLVPLASQPSTNTQHERLGLQVYNELQAQMGGRKHISFNDHRDVFHYPKEDTHEEEMEKEEEEDVGEDDGTEVEEEEADEEDPVTEAERLQFSSAGCPNPEEEAEQEEAEYLSMFEESDSNVHIDIPKEVCGLRMRNRRET